MSARLEAIERALAAGSVDPFAWYARAMELRSLGRREDALEAFDAVAARFPAYVPTYLMAAQVARELGQLDRARALCACGLDRARDAGDAHAEAELEAELDALA